MKETSGKCKAIASHGGPCGWPAMDNEDYCRAHSKSPAAKELEKAREHIRAHLRKTS